MRDSDSLPCPATASTTTAKDPSDRAEAALLHLARLLGRQAARDIVFSEAAAGEALHYSSQEPAEHD